MLYIQFKIINPATRIVASNLKEEIKKASLAKFINNVKDLSDEMSSNYTINIDKREHHEGYVHHFFRALLSQPNSTFNGFIEIKRMIWTQDQKTPHHTSSGMLLRITIPW